MPRLSGLGAGSVRSFGLGKNKVPGAPTIGAASANTSTSANVAFTAPANNGGAPITKYTAVSSPGNITGILNQAGSGTIGVSGLTSGTAYTFTVYATNSVGNGPSSAASASVTPQTPAPTSVSVFMYGGGGNGGNRYGGGGGGGAGNWGTQNISVGTTYSITVAGAGGTSSFACYSAAGGYNGGTCSGYGGDSGNGYSGYQSYGGGGGGAGGPGGAAGCYGPNPHPGGPGGSRYVDPFGNYVEWGGGGGGGCPSLLGVPNNGGYYGGGSGGGYARDDWGNTYDALGRSGTAGGGGGGGGVTNWCAPTCGGPGGSGYVVIWYSTSYRLPTTITGSYSTGTGSGYRYYAFTGSGSIKW